MEIRHLHALPVIRVCAREKVSFMQHCLHFLYAGPDFQMSESDVKQVVGDKYVATTTEGLRD